MLLLFAISVSMIAQLYPSQRWVVQKTIEAAHSRTNLDQLIIFPTGFGKSLCYQAPLGQLENLSIVVFPLIGLIRDQARRLQDLGVEVLTHYGDRPLINKRTRSRLRMGRGKVLLTNLENLQSPSLLKSLAGRLVDHLVLDEAHTLSGWGSSFRPALLQWKTVLESLRPMVCTAMTATLTKKASKDLITHFFMDRTPQIMELSPDRPELSWEILPTLAPFSELLREIRNCQGPVLVFARTRRRVHELANSLFLRMGDRKILAYHAAQDSNVRKAMEERFRTDNRAVMVATKAYGMGMDKADIRKVIHFDPSESLDELLQEGGRAGRDGLPAKAISLHYPGAVVSPEMKEFFSCKNCLREILLRPFGGLKGPCSGCSVCHPSPPRYPLKPGTEDRVFGRKSPVKR